MRDIFLTHWKPKFEHIISEYGIVPYLVWCRKEMKRIPGTYLVFQVEKGKELVCLKRKIEEEKDEEVKDLSRFRVV